MLTVLKQRNFALLWFGQLVSVLGDYFLYVSLPFVVYQQTGSALAAGGLFIVEIIPSLAFGSVAGVFVDRWDRRRTMLVADLLRAITLLPLLFVVREGWLWLVYPVMFLNGTISQFFYSARAAILPRIVADEDLASANGLINLGEEIGIALGSVAGGVLLAVVGLNALIMVDFTTYLLSALAIVLIAAPLGRAEPSDEMDDARETRPWRKVFIEWAAGMRLVRRDRLVATIFLITGVAAIGEGILLVLFVAFVGDVLGGGAEEFGWLNGARGIGTITAGLLVGALAARLSLPRLIVFSGLANGLLLFGFVNARALPFLLLFSALAGLTVVAFYIGQQTLLQQGVGDAYLGRVFGAYETLQGAVLLAGMALASLLAGPLGVEPLLNVAAALIVLGALIGLIAWRRGVLTTQGDIAAEPVSV